jgi:hypothetical protein
MKASWRWNLYPDSPRPDNPRPSQQKLAGVREPDAAGGAIHQANAEPFFRIARHLTETGNRGALCECHAPEIPGTCDSDESIEISKIHIIHCPV